jgi:hypothetical protein
MLTHLPPPPPASITVVFWSFVRLLGYSTRTSILTVCVSGPTHISCVLTDSNKMPLIILFWIGSMHFIADHCTGLLCSITTRVNCAFSLTSTAPWIYVTDQSTTLQASGQLHAPSVSPSEETALIQETWWAERHLWTLWQREMWLPLLGIEPDSAVFGSRSEDAIHTELSRLCILLILREFVMW